MPRWAQENDFDAIIAVAADQYGVSPNLIKAIIAAESRFYPGAIRQEAPRPSLPPTPDFPNGGDISYGLMQILGRTARGLGYDGPLASLLDPETNIMLGTRLLAQHLWRLGSVADSVSAYNGGVRPALGYGAVRADGTYANEAYVQRVMGYMDYFAGASNRTDAEGALGPPRPAPFPAAPVVPGGRPVFWVRVARWFAFIFAKLRGRL